MPFTYDVPALELSAMMCSKVCHDLVSSISAMSMSLEMLDEPGASDEALDLIRRSVATASARLQFFRLAFGASGSTGAGIDTGDAEKVAMAFIADEKPDLTWNVERAILPKNQVKLLLNLLIVSIGTVPRGGTIEVRTEGDENDLKITLRSEGRRARVPVDFEEMVDGDIPEGGVTSHNAQAYHTMLLASETNMPVSVEFEAETVTIRAG